MISWAISPTEILLFCIAYGVTTVVSLISAIVTQKGLRAVFWSVMIIAVPILGALLFWIAYVLEKRRDTILRTS